MLVIEIGGVVVYTAYLMKQQDVARKDVKSWKVWSDQFESFKAFLFWQQLLRYFVHVGKTEIPQATLIWVFLFFQWGIIIGLVAWSISFILAGLFLCWKRRHFPTRVIFSVWPRLMLKFTNKVPIVRRLFSFLYAVFTAHRLSWEQKRCFIKQHEEKTQRLKTLSTPNRWRSRIRSCYPNGYRIRHQYSFAVLKNWETTKDPLQNHLNMFGRPRSMRQEKKTLRVKVAAKIQTGWRWCKKSLLETGEMQFYHMLNDF